MYILLCIEMVLYDIFLHNIYDVIFCSCSKWKMWVWGCGSRNLTIQYRLSMFITRNFASLVASITTTSHTTSRQGKCCAYGTNFSMVELSAAMQIDKVEICNFEIFVFLGIYIWRLMKMNVNHMSKPFFKGCRILYIHWFSINN